MNKILLFLYLKLNLILLLPHPTAVGNCSVEIFEAIRIASLRNKKILLILPFYINTRFIPIKTLNPKLFSLESKYFLVKPLSKKIILLRVLIWAVFIPLILVSFYLKLLGLSWSKKDFYPYYGTFILFNLSDTPQVMQFDMERIKEEKKMRSDIFHYDIKLSPQVNNKADLFMKNIGKKDDDWFICLHVRTSEFYQDQISSPYRNANISNYIDLINYITEKEGWVFRLGDDSMPRLDKNLLIKSERVLDLAHSKFNTAEINAWLIANCNSYIGMQSGLFDYAKLFLKPIILVNMYSPFFGVDNEKNIIGFYKKFVNKINGFENTPIEVIQTAEFQENDFSPIRFSQVELTGAEILKYTSDLLPVQGKQFKNVKRIDRNKHFDSSISAVINMYSSKDKFSNTELYRWVLGAINLD